MATPTFDYLRSPLTDARTAGNIASAEAIRHNNGRTIPRVPNRVQKLSTDECVWVYNVGPFHYRREFGSAGSFFVPQCKEGQKYAVMAPIPGIFSELIIKDETTFERRDEAGDEDQGGASGGLYMAQQVVGIGKMLRPADALTLKGVFIGSQVGPRQKCEGCGSRLSDLVCRNKACDSLGVTQAAFPVPLEAEVTAAREALDRYAHDLTNEADLAHRKGPDEQKNIVTDIHHWAASYQKLEPKEHLWMRSNVAASQGNQTCGMCSHVSPRGTVLCPNCRTFVFDREKYDALKSQMA